MKNKTKQCRGKKSEEKGEREREGENGQRDRKEK
tara:strand:- start:1990 stop:2091 length:102 start_codon:yes stop_codon:yes gene_type:complete